MFMVPCLSTLSILLENYSGKGLNKRSRFGQVLKMPIKSYVNTTVKYTKVKGMYMQLQQF